MLLNQIGRRNGRIVATSTLTSHYLYRIKIIVIINVVVKFPSMEHAEAFYNDPDYQPFKKIRHKYAQCDSVIVEQGFDPAS